MKYPYLLGIALTAALPALGVRLLLPDDTSPPADLRGAWQVVHFEAEGRTEAAVVGTRCLIGAGTLRFDEGPPQTCKFGGGRGPRPFDTLAVSGDSRVPYGMTGIYKLEGDTLTLCYRPPHEASRPTDFRAAQGSPASLMVLRRVEDGR